MHNGNMLHPAPHHTASAATAEIRLAMLPVVARPRSTIAHCLTCHQSRQLASVFWSHGTRRLRSTAMSPCQPLLAVPRATFQVLDPHSHVKSPRKQGISMA
jgi:hypothetical protein